MKKILVLVSLMIFATGCDFFGNGASKSDSQSAVTAPVIQEPVAEVLDVSDIDNITMVEMDTKAVNFVFSASGSVSFSCGVSCPSFMTINNSGFSLSPILNQRGVYRVEVVATMGSLSQTKNFDIVVNRYNHSPAIFPSSDQSILENEELNFLVYATDFDGDATEVFMTGLPEGAVFNDHNHFIWTPGYNAMGEYNVVIRATDGIAEVFQTIKIIVNNVNRAPVFQQIAQQTISQNTLLTFNIVANDADGDTVGISSSNLPNGATLVNNVFSWTPACGSQIGDYTVSFIATDSVLTVQQDVSIHVNHTNCEGVNFSSVQYPFDIQQYSGEPLINLSPFGTTGMISTFVQFSTYPYQLSYNLDGILTYHYAGMWMDCFNTTKISVQDMNKVIMYPEMYNYDMSHGASIRVTNITENKGADYIYVLMYAEDIDGDRGYFWIRTSQNIMGQWTLSSRILQGSTYDSSSFCATTAHPEGYVHTN